MNTITSGPVSKEIETVAEEIHQDYPEETAFFGRLVGGTTGLYFISKHCIFLATSPWIMHEGDVRVTIEEFVNVDLHVKEK